MPDDRTDTFIKQLRGILNPSVQLVLTVVPQQKSDRYAAIKKLCCIEMPVPSQVVCLKTISNEKRLQSVAQKVVLQINCKLGGELWACQTPIKKLMVVGIDVFHDKSRKSGSIAGCVASINDGLSRYFSTVAIQKQGQEIIDALKVAFMQALIRYLNPRFKLIFSDCVHLFQVFRGQQLLTRLCRSISRWCIRWSNGYCGQSRKYSIHEHVQNGRVFWFNL